jgi:hypothetical protein
MVGNIAYYYRKSFTQGYVNISTHDGVGIKGVKPSNNSSDGTLVCQLSGIKLIPTRQSRLLN